MRAWYLLVVLVGVAVGVGVEELARAHSLDAIITEHLRSYLRQHQQESHLQEGLIQPYLRAHLARVARYVKEYDTVVGPLVRRTQGAEGGQEAGADPVLSLLVARRLVKDWSWLRDVPLLSQHWQSVVLGVSEAEVGVGVVGVEQHLVTQTHVLTRLQHLYNLNPAHVARPAHHSPPSLVARKPQQASTDTRTTPTNTDHIRALRASDLAAIGVGALEQGMYGRAAEWFTAALDAAREAARDTDEDSKASEQELIVNRERQIQQLGILLDLAITVHDHQLMKSDQEKKMGNYPLPLSQTPLVVQKAREEEDAVMQLEESDSLPATPTDHRATVRLCRGHTLMSEWERSRLRCRVDARGSWWLMLMPAKVEEHSLQPLILSFHHVLSHRQLVILRHLARPLLEAAKVHGLMEDSTFAYRSSYNAWLHGDVHPVVRAANRMIAALTGLEVDVEEEAAELLQANLYAAGGHYAPHMDFVALYRTLWEADEPDQKVMKQFQTGDRIATFMFYMNDVEEGGRTVFPRVGVGVEPEVGSAVFWYNLSPSGKGDHRTLHSACPVLRGTKWVSNKWIKYYPQLHHKPCLPLVK